MNTALLLARLGEVVSEYPYTVLLLSVIVLYTAAARISGLVAANPKAPYPELRSIVKPSFFSLRSLDWFKNGHQIIHDGYARYPNDIFQVPSQDRTSLVLPLRFLEEIGRLPSTIASNSRATSDFFFGAWTTIDMDMVTHSVVDTVKGQYIAKIGDQIGPTWDEATCAFGGQFHSYPDWTPIKPLPRVVNIVAQSVARTIVGKDICRDPKWIKSIIGYASNVFLSAITFKMLPAFLRPAVALFTPFLYRIHGYRRSIRSMLAPAIEQKLALKREQPKDWEALLRKGQPCSIDWLIENSPPEKLNVKDLAHGISGIHFGATHTTSNHIVNCLLELAAHFEELAPVLRAEIDEVLGPSRERLSNADLCKMWKLDSFMKECQRFHSTSLLTVNRTFVEPYTLSSGDKIPANVHVSFAGVSMGFSDEFFAKPDHFDAFRFERMRHQQGPSQKGLQFATSAPGCLNFGYGKQMCPGRFMGGMMSKILLIMILDRYDLALGESSSRPENLAFMEMDAPDPACQILVRDRS
jgi:cytochrome P450